jgi:predicted outer membrane repeat protein
LTGRPIIICQLVVVQALKGRRIRMLRFQTFVLIISANSPWLANVEARQWEIDTSGSISNSVVGLKPGDQLYLGNGTYFGRNNCNVSLLVSNITIIGSPGRTIIDCNGTDRQFIIFGSNITLANVELTNGYAKDHGGCIKISRAASTRILNTQLSNCFADNNLFTGGGIHVDGTPSNSPVQLENVSFLNCSAFRGGAISLLSSSIFASACSFVQNEAQTLGGAVYLQGFSRATFLGNMTLFDGNIALRAGGKRGGAVCLLDGSFLNASGKMRFFRNIARSGGAIYAQGATLVFQEVEFQGNSALELGGALSGQSTNVKLSITFLGITVFRSNWIAWNGVGKGGGGSIYSQGTAGVVADMQFKSMVTMENNRAPTGGALLLVTNSQMKVDGQSTFASNAAVTSDGGVAYLDSFSVLSMASADLHGNTAAKRGGAIYLSNSIVTLRGDVSHNSARDAGGAMALYGASTANLSDVRLELNAVNNILRGFALPCEPTNPCGGGAIFLADQSSLLLGPAVLRRNDAGGSDGGALLLCGQTTTAVYNTSIESNTADGRGGGAGVLDNSSLFVSSSFLGSNRAGGDGGGVYSEGRNVSLNSTIFASNTAGQDGGGICAISPLHTQLSILFKNNSAEGQGGAIFSSGDDAVIVVGLDASMEFYDNTAGTDGGAVAFEDRAKFHIDVALCPPACKSMQRGDGFCDFEW